MSNHARPISRAWTVLLAAVLLGGCAGSAPSTPATLPAESGRIEISVLAAASLRKALAAAAEAWSAEHPGQSIALSSDSSTALAAKIEQGAPADLFLSADATAPRSLAADGLTAGSPVTFARNSLVVIVPADNPAGIRSPADLARPGVKVIAAGDSVPVTGYATQLMANLARQPGYPAEFEAAYEANVVSKEDSVAGVLARIALGEGDAGIVYATDAAASKDVRTVAIPDGAGVTAVYDGVVIANAPHGAAAAELLEWLAGPKGRELLTGFGFLPAR